MSAFPPEPAYALRFEQRAGILHAAASGAVITEPVALSALKRVAAKCEELGTSLLLMENALEGQLSVTSIYHVCQAMSGMGFRGVRIAYLDRRGLDFGKALFAETVAVNRGLFVRAFRDSAAAEEWLLSEPRE